MADEAMLDLVRQHMRDVRVPGHHDKVRPLEAGFDDPLDQQQCTCLSRCP